MSSLGASRILCMYLAKVEFPKMERTAILSMVWSWQDVSRL